jgi:regulatory protein
MTDSSKYISKNDAYLKLRTFCAYQDRCHSEVRSKLISYKVYGDDLEEIITELIDENFLDEERFARSYARGKFRIKKWGKSKITQELKRRKVSAYCIKKGLSEIDQEEYLATAKTLLTKYYNKLTGIDPIKRKKTFEHGVRKGYEFFVINDILNELRKR